MTGPVYDAEAERSLLAHALLIPADIRPLTGELGLGPQHFYLPGHQAIWHAMIDLHDAGDGIDQVAVSRRVGPDNARALADIIGLYYTVDAYRDHAKRILACHRYERVRRAGVELSAAAEQMDDTALADAERQLTEPDGSSRDSMLTGEQRRERALDRMQQEHVPTMPLPWRAVNTLISGGMWPGRYMVLSGHTAHGKSVACDQLLEHVAVDHRVAVYLTETTEQERTERSLARNGPLTYGSVQRFFRLPVRQRHGDHVTTIADGIRKLPDVICVEAHDWTAQEIARHITHHRWDLAAVDIFHDLPLTPGNDHEIVKLKEMGRLLSQTAKATGVALVNVMHLNEKRVIDRPPIPVNSDIYGPAALYKQADVVMMVWQEEDDDGPTGDGVIRVTKCRQGRPGTMKARFVGDKQRWESLDDGLRAVA